MLVSQCYEYIWVLELGHKRVGVREIMPSKSVSGDTMRFLC